jgi:hypothetical protein
MFMGEPHMANTSCFSSANSPSASGKHSASWFAPPPNASRALGWPGWANTMRTSAKIIVQACFGTCTRRLRIKCTRHRYRLRPSQHLAKATCSPLCASLVTNGTSRMPR